MARGHLTVHIYGGSNLSNPEKEGKVCVIVYYKDQEQRTQAIYCDGPDPEWNEHLESFWIDDDIENLKLRIHDGDHVTEEEIGYCEVSLESLLETGDEAEIESTSYDCYRNNEDDPYGMDRWPLASVFNQWKEEKMKMKNAKSMKTSVDMVDGKNK